MENGRLRIGIIGTGVGLRTHLPGFRRTARAEIVGLSGSDFPRAQKFAVEYGIPHAFPDFRALCESDEIDLVCVASPNPFHAEQVEHALNCHKHVLAEKPLGMNLAEVTRLATLEAQTDKITLVDHQLRFNPYLKKLRDLIQANALGRLYHLRMHQQSNAFSNPSLAWNWSFDERMGGGVRLAMASHLIDLLWFWFGQTTIYRVNASLDAVLTRRRDTRGVDRDVTASSFFAIQLDLKNSLNVQLSATAAAFGESRFDVSLFGTDGEIHFTLQEKLRGSFKDTRGKLSQIPVDNVTPEEVQNKVSIFSGSFVYFAPLIVAGILDGDMAAIATAARFKDAIPTQSLLDSVLASSSTGESVRLNPGYSTNSKV